MTGDPEPEPGPRFFGTEPYDDTDRCVGCGRFLKEFDHGPICRQCWKEDEEHERNHEYPE